MNGLQMAQFHQWLTLTDLGAFVICTEQPDHWLPMMRHIGFTRMASCDQVVDGVPLGCYLHDWRAAPMSRWLEAMVDLELGRERAADDPRRQAAGHLAHLYELARYAPEDEPLPESEMAAARRDLSLLAGAGAA